MLIVMFLTTKMAYCFNNERVSVGVEKTLFMNECGVFDQSY